jgi:murein DD-endopeptidase MepM/ murein hydrolase activator NlpD
MRVVITILVLLLLGAGGAWWMAGRSTPPAIEIPQPSRLIGQKGDLTVVVKTPGGELTELRVVISQGDKSTGFSYEGNDAASLAGEGGEIRITRPIGKRDIPELVAGPAKITVTAVRPVLFGYRKIEATVSKDVEVRLNPPLVGVQSTHHYINHGGSEMVVYRVTGEAAESGVRVGDIEYPGFPASGAGVPNADGLYVAFFALLWDQDPNTSISVFARDEVNNESTASFDYRVFPKAFRKSRIEIDDRFLQKVVPTILHNTPELDTSNDADLAAKFVRINRDLRRDNNAKIASLANETDPKILWQGPFKQLVNTAVEAGFADQRTYVYKGQDIDNAVHLGYDLASLSMAPVQASNRGKVLFAGWLGIYGNCVILDHGMGLQSLYAHLSSIDVKVGDLVDLGGRLGRTGATGLAAGDHLHFTMLLDGRSITPVDWWSAQWVKDRILRKMQEAGAPAG